MNLKDLKPLFDKIPWTLLLVLYLGNLGWDYYNFENAEDSPKVMKMREIDVAKEELEKLRDRVRKAEAFLRGLDGKKAEIKRLLQELESTKTTLSENLDVPELMTAILTEAKRTGVTVLSFTPGQPKTAEYYTEQAFELKYKGIFFQVVAFLDRISNLQKIVRVDNLNLERAQGTTSAARYVELTGAIELKAYRYNRSQADEVPRPQLTEQSAPAGTGVKSPAPASAPAAGGVVKPQGAPPANAPDGGGR